MNVSDKEAEDLRRMQSKLKEIADTPLGDPVSSVITPPPQKGVSTAEIAQLVIILTETMQENNRKLTEVTEAINAIQDSCTQADK